MQSSHTPKSIEVCLPQIALCVMLCLFFHLNNQPLEQVWYHCDVESSSAASSSALVLSISSLIRIDCVLAAVNQRYRVCLHHFAYNHDHVFLCFLLNELLALKDTLMIVLSMLGKMPKSAVISLFLACRGFFHSINNFKLSLDGDRLVRTAS